jgi:hypothetical protein
MSGVCSNERNENSTGKSARNVTPLRITKLRKRRSRTIEKTIQGTLTNNALRSRGNRGNCFPFMGVLSSIACSAASREVRSSSSLHAEHIFAMYREMVGIHYERYLDVNEKRFDKE